MTVDSSMAAEDRFGATKKRTSRDGLVREFRKSVHGCALPVSQDWLKGAKLLMTGRLLRLAGFTPFGPVFHNPVREGAFEADIVASLFRLDPLMPQNLLALCLKLPIERGVLQQVARRRLFRVFRHTLNELKDTTPGALV